MPLSPIYLCISLSGSSRYFLKSDRLFVVTLEVNAEAGALAVRHLCFPAAERRAAYEIVTVTNKGDRPVRLSAIASGGSQAVFFKVNTFGEEAFLDKLRELLAGYEYYG